MKAVDIVEIFKFRDTDQRFNVIICKHVLLA